MVELYCCFNTNTNPLFHTCSNSFINMKVVLVNSPFSIHIFSYSIQIETVSLTRQSLCLGTDHRSCSIPRISTFEGRCTQLQENNWVATWLSEVTDLIKKVSIKLA